MASTLRAVEAAGRQGAARRWRRGRARRSGRRRGRASRAGRRRARRRSAGPTAGRGRARAASPASRPSARSANSRAGEPLGAGERCPRRASCEVGLGPALAVRRGGAAPTASDEQREHLAGHEGREADHLAGADTAPISNGCRAGRARRRSRARAAMRPAIWVSSPRITSAGRSWRRPGRMWTARRGSATARPGEGAGRGGQGTVA